MLTSIRINNLNVVGRMGKPLNRKHGILTGKERLGTLRNMFGETVWSLLCASTVMVLGGAWNRAYCVGSKGRRLADAETGRRAGCVVSVTRYGGNGRSHAATQRGT